MGCVLSCFRVKEDIAGVLLTVFSRSEAPENRTFMRRLRLKNIRGHWRLPVRRTQTGSFAVGNKDLR